MSEHFFPAIRVQKGNSFNMLCNVNTAIAEASDWVPEGLTKSAGIYWHRRVIDNPR